MGAALLVEYYQRMPTRRAKDDAETWRKRQEEGRQKFLNLARARYTEGTLLRLLDAADARAKRAALLALGKIGGMTANDSVAARLQDEDAEVRQLAADALWGLWFRADTDENNQELQRLVRLRDREKALAGLDQLIERAPHFAEAYNQRAILFFRLKQYDRSIADCEKALRAQPAPLRRPGWHGPVLRPASQAEGRPQGVPHRPEPQPQPRRRRRNHPGA